MNRMKYWYKETIFYCPVCGREDKHKSRMYTKKPKDWNKRHELIETYDYCNE